MTISHCTLFSAEDLNSLFPFTALDDHSAKITFFLFTVLSSPSYMSWDVVDDIRYKTKCMTTSMQASREHLCSRAP